MRILVIEDNPGDVRLVQENLRDAGDDPAIAVAERLAQGLAHLRSHDVDVVLLDLGLPDSRGLDTLVKLRKRSPDVPVVVMTSIADEELAVEAVRLGAQDYLIKGEVDSALLRRSLAYAVERKRADAEIKSLANIPAENPNPVLRLSADGAILFANEAGRVLLRAWGDGASETAPDLLRTPARKALARRAATTVDIERDGQTWSFSIAPVTGYGYVNLYGRNITERKQAEEALRNTTAKYSRILETALNGFWIVDANGRFLEVNDAYCRMSGYSRKELLRRSIADVEAIEAPQEITARILKLEERKNEHFVTQHRRKDGSIIDLEINLTFVDDAGTGLSVAFAQDITDRRRAEEKLGFQAHLLDGVLEAAVATDTEDKIVFWNRGAEMLFGWTSGEALGHRIEERAPLARHDHEGVRPLIWKGQSWSGEHEHGHRDGSLFPAHCTMSPIFDRERKVVGVLSLTSDISERKRAEEELRAALAAKDDFLSMVSHEMRTPLTSILGNASLLSDPELGLEEADRAQMLQDIHDGAKRLAGTIDDMLALARVQTGRVSTIGPVGLRAAVAEAVAQHRVRHPFRKVKTRVLGEPPVVLASKEYLAHIMSNLLENAQKYAPASKPIAVEMQCDGKEALVRVLDQGIGLTPDETEHIFEPFYRSARIPPTSPGLGIGLSVCKRLVEELGGRIYAQPRPGGGAEFGFTLPLSSRQDSDA